MYAPRRPTTDSTSRFELPTQAAVDSGAVFDALADSDCRRILEETTDDALTARELTSECDIPTSTLYRKLEQLAEVGLLEERVRIRRDGKHASEYRQAFAGLTVSVSGDSGVEVDVSAPADSQSAEPLLAVNR